MLIQRGNTVLSEEDLPKQINLLARSARKRGVWLTVKGVGLPYGGHYESKIIRLRRWIDELPPYITDVMYIDAKDSVLVAGISEIERKFRALGAPIIVSSEGCCFPDRSPEWARRFPERHGGRNWICAGAFMVQRRSLIEALDALRDLSDRLNQGGREIESVEWMRKDDQWLWQAAQILGLFPLDLDETFSIFASIACEAHYGFVDNPVFAFEPGRVVDKTSGEAPCALHFSGAYNHCMHQWAG